MTRKGVYMSDNYWDKMLKIKDEKGFNSLGKVIEYLLDNYSIEQNGLTQAQLVATILAENQKYDLNIIRNRTEYADKSLKILLNMVNDVVINKNFDMKPDETIYNIVNAPSVMYQKAEEKVLYFEEQNKQ